MVNQMRRDSFVRAAKVKLIIMDVDGTLTDGGIYIGESGELFKPFNCRDGLGINLARKVGIETAILTGRESKQVLIRAQELKINPELIFQGHEDKRAAYIEIKNKFRLKDEEIAYIGDDIIDLPIMVQVGFTGTVANAVTEVKNRVCVVSDFKGGQGAVREIIEFILKAKGVWNDIINEYCDPNFKVPKQPFYLAANKSNLESKPQQQPIKPPAAPTIRTQQPIQSTTPKVATTPTTVSTRSTIQSTTATAAKINQPEKDENLEKLERIGKRLNTKF